MRPGEHMDVEVNNELQLIDEKGNKIYSKNSNGFWFEYQYDEKGNLVESCWKINKKGILQIKDVDKWNERLINLSNKYLKKTLSVSDNII